MSDEEEESMSEGFSASEDEWKPAKKTKGESSDEDDDDSEYDEADIGAGRSDAANKKKDTKGRGVANKAVAKRKKTLGQSLRTKLYNKYRPPPKTISSPNSAGHNSPSASTSRTASKNLRTPNESNNEAHDSSSESSVDNYFVKANELDLHSSFFYVQKKKQPTTGKCTAAAPLDNCFASGNLSDSGSEDNNETSGDEKSKVKAFDFRQLLENASSLERMKETIEKRNIQKEAKEPIDNSTTAQMDVNALLALGEKQNLDSDSDDGEQNLDVGPSKLSKTKSTRVKRHVKTRPTSTVMGGDTDESDFEEVAEHSTSRSGVDSSVNNVDHSIEIQVEIPSVHGRNREKKKKEDIEMAFRRKINRDMKDRQLLLHKASLLCLFGRSYKYNRILNDTPLMTAALKLLPSKDSYPNEGGTEVKYFQSLVTWFKSTVKVADNVFYSTKRVRNKRKELLQQIQRKEALCKQDLVFILVVLLRGMGIQCRLIVNLLPLPIRPAQSDLLVIKLKPDDGNSKETVPAKKSKLSERSDISTKASPATKSEKKEDQKLTTGAKHKSAEKSKAQEKKKPIEGNKIAKNSEDDIEKKLTGNKPSTSIKAKGKSVKIQASTSLEVKRVNRTRQKPTTFDEDTDPKILITRSTEDKGKKELRTSASRGKNKLPIKENNLNQEANYVAPSEIMEKNIKKSNLRTKPNIKKLSVSNSASISNNIKEHKDVDLNNVEATSTSISNATATKSKTKAPKISKLIVQTADNAKINKSDEKLRVPSKRILRPRQNTNDAIDTAEQNKKLTIPQLDGADDFESDEDKPLKQRKNKNAPQLKKLKSRSKEESDDDFKPSPPKKPKQAPMLPKAVQNLRKDRRVLSTDEESTDKPKRNANAADMWVEVWSDKQEQWVCIDLVKGKVDSVESIRKSASSILAYVFAFQSDLSIKDVTARYCTSWAATLRKSRVDKSWLEMAISPYYGMRTERDKRENRELRRLHEEKPMPTTISEFKDHPLYALQRHLLKFQAIYPPNAPTLGFIRSEPIYSRFCVHTLHSREIWLKDARTVKLGEEPYKIVKARPKWDRLTQTVIKDQPLEIFGYWQTEEYDPPTAENGIVPRNAYGNVELFKECMLPKKTAHIRLPGLQRICKKLGIDCANAVTGFDFHQGTCHPTYDGFVICEEFRDQVTAAWYQDQEEQERKEQEKYEARVYGNWKKLIRGLLIRERLKKKYNM